MMKIYIVWESDGECRNFMGAKLTHEAAEQYRQECIQLDQDIYKELNEGSTHTKYHSSNTYWVQEYEVE